MEEELSSAWQQAYSIENMEMHGEAGKKPEYIGSLEKMNRIYDFFRDDSGHYWYSVRIRQQDGRAVPEEEAVFGHPIRQITRKKGAGKKKKRM